MKIKMMVTVSTLLFCFSSFSYSDDTYLGSLGGNPFPHPRADSIRMVREHVYVHLDQGLSHVKCRFWFYNFGSEQTVRMGFPNFFFNVARASEPIKNFTCKINGMLDTVVEMQVCTNVPGNMSRCNLFGRYVG